MPYFTIGRGDRADTDITIHPYGLKHSPPFVTYIASYNVDEGTVELLDVSTREIDGEEIGDYKGARLLKMPEPKELISPFQHCRSLEELESAVQGYIAIKISASRSGVAQCKVPIETELSNLIYSSHDPILPGSDTDQVHVAVTFVDHLTDDDDQSLRLPVSFTAAFFQRLGANDVRGELLSQFERELSDATRARLLETYSTTRLTLHLLVMPQGLEHGTMYIWQKGPLSQFLSAAYVASLDRRLYMEARLAPITGATMRQDQYINLTGNADDVSEGDDFDNGYLSETDSRSGSSCGSLDSTSDTSASHVGYTTQVECIPPKTIDEKPMCEVIVDIDTSNLPDVNHEVFVRPIYTIPLEASPRSVAEHILRHACTSFRTSQSEMMLSLKAQNKGIHMRSFTTFGDDRDAYFHRDSDQNSRIAKLSDLFLNRKSLRSHPSIPIVVKIDIIDLNPAVPTFDSTEYQPLHKHMAFHRIATGAQRSSPPSKKSTGKYKILPASTDADFIGPREEIQLKPLQAAHMHIYPRAIPGRCPVVGVACREINGVLIGDVRDVDENPNRMDEIPVEKYRNVLEVMRHCVAVGKMFDESGRMGVRSGVPTLPSLTFLPYVGRGVKSLEGMRMHVAVSLVNTLSDSKVSMPVGVVVKVGDGEGMRDVICKALSGKLREVFTAKGGSGGIKMMDAEQEWKWDLWVLPQKSEGKAKVMYRFREGSLKVFLDEEMVNEGVRTLYMEAHIMQK